MVIAEFIETDKMCQHSEQDTATLLKFSFYKS